ncbi:MAG: hypothetical protein KC944_17490, partial [Candidatus Omnitrophica bacterium]|nr:hypothetical protein [Candidatus Omnitrophota bacterium]
GDIQTGWGGAVYCASATGSFEHCTFRDNQSDQADGLYISTEWADGTGTGSRIEIKNSILWNRLVIKNSTVEVSYSDTLEPIGGPGNLSLDPRFTEAAIPGSPTFDYRIKLESPCIDAATDSEVAADIEGNPRPVDVLGRGNDSGFDMGCYEFQLKKSDLTRDGKVDAEDLLMFQEEWMREEE